MKAFRRWLKRETRVNKGNHKRYNIWDYVVVVS